MERKLDFAYTPKEAVLWAYGSGVHSRIFRGRADDLEYNQYTREGVDKMRAKGWDNDKILRMCSENLVRNRESLPEIIISGHPINTEWDQNDVRLALQRIALDQITTTKTKVLRSKIDGTSSDWRDYQREEVEMLENFVKLLTQDATPARGIRNR